MLRVLGVARVKIDQRLLELEGATLLPEPPRVVKTGSRAHKPLDSLCVQAGHACGRRIAAAFRRARTAADGATAGMLYGALRAIERQIWLLDPHHGRAWL